MELMEPVPMLSQRTLNSPANKTGTESVYTTHDGFEMMFHVSTLLPYSSSDSSQVRAAIEGARLVTAFTDARPWAVPLSWDIPSRSADATLATTCAAFSMWTRTTTTPTSRLSHPTFCSRLCCVGRDARGEGEYEG